MRAGIAAIVGITWVLATGGVAGQPSWRWPHLPAGIAAPTVPIDNGMNAAKVALGRRLFYDRALSRDGSMACADCHQQSHGFSDGQPTHVGVTGDMGVRNVPGLTNLAWRSGFTWTEAGITSLEAQAMVPMTGTKPVEMGMAGYEAQLTQRLNADPCYRLLFLRAFSKAPDGANYVRVTQALGAFQRTMISFGSPHDRGMLTPLAQKGAAQFAAAGCATCHSGPDLTDGQVHYVGTAALGEADGSLYGGKPLPPGFEPPPEQFRTPSLRNVAMTGPWLHDGQSPSMDAAIRRHAAAQLAGVDMSALLAFLDSLTDPDFLTNKDLGPPPAGCPVNVG